jgi:hypothetical protein
VRWGFELTALLRRIVARGGGGIRWISALGKIAGRRHVDSMAGNLWAAESLEMVAWLLYGVIDGTSICVAKITFPLGGRHGLRS